MTETTEPYPPAPADPMGPPKPGTPADMRHGDSELSAAIVRLEEAIIRARQRDTLGSPVKRTMFSLDDVETLIQAASYVDALQVEYERVTGPEFGSEA